MPSSEGLTEAIATGGEFVAIDLEVCPEGRIQSLGAVRGPDEIRHGPITRSAALRVLGRFSEGASFLVGHNALFHDRRFLVCANEEDLLPLPWLDTLLLSALAFPRRPYHRLVKDYKLVRTAPNDPVADARLALRVLADSVRALATADPRLCALIRTACAEGLGGSSNSIQQLAVAESRLQWTRPLGDRGGHELLLSRMGAPHLSRAMAVETFVELHGDRICATHGPAAVERAIQEDPLVMAFVAAWIGATEIGSVIPAWVRGQFPSVVTLSDQLRSQPCTSPECVWCRSESDAVSHLRRVFGFDGFRAEPATPDGRSLQQSIVEAGMRGVSHLAILPTGGGKSLCFQLPALVRHRHRGQLTVVVSPLQALMKDQVDGLIAKTGGRSAAALNGLLTPPERSDVLEQVRLGEVAILYISPEQLRSPTCARVLASREIGTWVFDEAHCLSKWGHDFRPDYLYAARFIRELAGIQSQPVPAIACLTATAKRDVRDEIIAHFRNELGLELELFEGGVERQNLSFRVEQMPGSQKPARVQQLLEETLVDSGAAVVYCATQRETEELADFLNSRQIPAIAYHAGLSAPDRRERQEAFLRDDHRVVCATNAFGMGIDKPDVRIVIHLRMPASLENYLQEAGRAGRDRMPARCVLLHCAEDPEYQFRLLARARLSQHDIQQLLRGLRSLRNRVRSPDDRVVVTSGELLRQDSVDVGFDIEGRDAHTRVLTALAWLEKAGLVRRDENRTGVLSARPKTLDPEEFLRILAEQSLLPLEAAMWRQAFRALVDAPLDTGIQADDLAALPAFRTWEQAEAAKRNRFPVTAGQKALRVLHDMARAGLLVEGLRLTAFLRDRVRDPSSQRFADVCLVEARMLDVLREEAPDADAEDAWLTLSLRQLNQRLSDEGLPSQIDRLRKLLYGLARDGRGLAGRSGSLELRHTEGDLFQVLLRRRWDDLLATASKRRDVARVALQAMQARIPADAPPRKDQFIDFSLEDVRSALDADLLLSKSIEDPLAAIERALLYLHELDVVILQRGLSVMRQAMAIAVPTSDGRRYTRADHEALRNHYAEQVRGVHVMTRYADKGLEDQRSAEDLVSDYFEQDREAFAHKYFADQRADLERQTGPHSYERIVTALGDPAQQTIVTADPNRAMLVLAGPGSGKTRVVVHRCAYLIRVLRVPARQILMVCFNRATALEIRRRLLDLLGSEARGVLTTTYHGIAARLCGKSFANRGFDQPVTSAELDRLLEEAVSLLEGRFTLPGLEDDAQRDLLLGGFRHILVDEYQDIDARQYALVSALSRRSVDEPPATILAVGDDDQAIYGFRDASVAFIRKFQDDYDAEVHELSSNYRATPSLVAATNAVIEAGRQRMKRRPISVDAARRAGLPGPPPDVIEVLASRHRAEVAQALVAFDMIRAAWTDAEPAPDIAVLAWRREALAPLRALCEGAGLPVHWAADDSARIPIAWVREVATWLDRARDRITGTRSATVSCRVLAEELQVLREGTPESPWWDYVDSMLQAWASRNDFETEVPVIDVLEFVHEVMQEDRRHGVLGPGITFRTLHGAKGLEFNEVLILDGGFRQDDGSADADEERRLFYVGATRARQRLTLISTSPSTNPHAAKLIAGGGQLLQRSAPDADPKLLDRLRLRYELLGANALFLDFAGRKRPGDPVHRGLATLRAGDRLMLCEGTPRLGLRRCAGGPLLAELSAEASGVWRARLAIIEEVRVIAVLRRRAAHCRPEFAAAVQTDPFEVPWIEVVWRA